ncbi:MAG: DUF1641 domain-containing protein [Thermoplasmataceae archaeon]|jgi:uncharacterized protein YjgD (DUF1641 family)|nr:DUF1641 domain-containing protein [Candidatus Thermoplasmatota archaeon]
MAKMTNKIVQEQDERKELNAAGVFQGHFDEIQSLLDLISAFKKSGILSLMNAILSQKDDVLEVVSSDLLNAENTRFIQNALSIYTLLSRVDPEKISRMVLTAADAMMNADVFKKDRPLGLLRINSMLKDPDLSAGIRVILSAIGAMTSSGKQQ